MRGPGVPCEDRINSCPIRTTSKGAKKSPDSGQRSNPIMPGPLARVVNSSCVPSFLLLSSFLLRRRGRRAAHGPLRLAAFAVLKRCELCELP
jgi:hypothetical protein